MAASLLVGGRSASAMTDGPPVEATVHLDRPVCIAGETCECNVQVVDADMGRHPIYTGFS